MKKKQVVGCIIAGCILFMNAVPWEGNIWEGNGVVAPNGDLPSAGLYVATNAFPRNTVVYITNLETERTVRVTVAAGLDNPGLLITLTQEAAEAIGMAVTSMARIKMIQPADPEAFSRYLAQIAQADMPESALSQAAETPARAEAEASVPVLQETPEERQEQPETTVPVVVIANDSEGPGDTEETLERDTINPGETPDGNPSEVPSVANSSTESLTLQEEPVLEDTFETAETHLPLEIPFIAQDDASPTIQEKPDDTKVAVSEVPRYNADTYNLRMTPAQERPPAERGITSLPPEAEIAPIADTPVTAPTEDSQSIDPNFVIDAIQVPLATVPAERKLTPFIPPIPDSSAIGTGFSLKFSVPVIRSLETGKYYLQLRAYRQPELVELELSKIKSSYPLTVQYSGTPEQPLYRILLGPMNLGESGALLQRFKSSGYPDAFVRQGM
ncbi:MAG: SPOR domain-containing protein [Treponema sp.]|nr:SPOR domain-containing protein [Treponema sp.]